MPKTITVVGAGFAGLSAVEELRHRNRLVTITVVAPRAEFVYLPSLIWVPAGLRRPDDLVVPLDAFFRRHRVKHVAAEATGLKDGGRTLMTTEGEVSNDGLIIASGGRFIRKLPGIEHAIVPCQGVASAVAIRDRVAAMDGGTIAFGFGSNPNEPSAMRGGPVFEFLFGMDRQLRREKRRDRFRLVFFNPSDKPGQRMGGKAVPRLLKEMARRGIDTHLGHKIKGFEADKVITEGGEIATDLIVFMPGMTGNAWFDDSELPRSPGGLVQGDEHCRVPGLDRVYVAGDSGSLPGPEWMPKQAHMADLQAKVAAANLLEDFKGRTGSETYRAELICIVDTLDQGMVVARTERFNLMLPSMRLWHWSKRMFERWYLRRFR